MRGRVKRGSLPGELDSSKKKAIVQLNYVHYNKLSWPSFCCRVQQRYFWAVSWWNSRTGRCVWSEEPDHCSSCQVRWDGKTLLMSDGHFTLLWILWPFTEDELLCIESNYLHSWKLLKKSLTLGVIIERNQRIKVNRLAVTVYTWHKRHVIERRSLYICCLVLSAQGLWPEKCWRPCSSVQVLSLDIV